MSNRATNAGLLDANSQLPISFQDSVVLNTVGSTLITTGQGVFHGFIGITPGTGGWGATAYDSSSSTNAGTLTSSTAVGALVTTTSGGVLGFQWAGDVIFNNGLVINNTGTTAGVIKVLYL